MYASIAQRGEGAAVVVDVAPGASAAQIADAVLQAVAPATTRPDEAPANDLWWWSVGAGGVAAVIGVAALSTWVLWPGEAPPPPPRPVPVTCCGL